VIGPVAGHHMARHDPEPPAAANQTRDSATPDALRSEIYGRADMILCKDEQAVLSIPRRYHAKCKVSGTAARRAGEIGLAGSRGEKPPLRSMSAQNLARLYGELNPSLQQAQT